MRDKTCSKIGLYIREIRGILQVCAPLHLTWQHPHSTVHSSVHSAHSASSKIHTSVKRALSYTADEKFGPLHAASVALEVGMIVAVHSG